jgi:ABC-type sugar transport system ATPase subunit
MPGSTAHRRHFNNPFRMSAIALRQLQKSFPTGTGAAVAALVGVDLSVASGELLALLGPSGCGKTTLLRLIAGLEQPDQGTVTIAGTDQHDVPAERREVAMVFQSLALYPHLTAAENLAFGLRLRGHPSAEVTGRVAATAAQLGLTDCLQRRPGELSGGQRQRIALGRALIRQPKVLLLDEPFSHLDAPLRRELRRELQRLHQELRFTAILVTHDPAEALALGEQVAVMHQGKILQVGRPEVLRTQPANALVREFIAPELL